MTLARLFSLILIVSISFNFFNKEVRADEGMWLYNNLPIAQIEKQYGFKLSPAMIENLMKSSVRISDGGSASFISSDGLVLTNHHVAAGALQRASSPERNLLRDGFLAKTQAEEIKATGVEFNQLESIEDVSEQVFSSVTAGMTEEEAFNAKQGAIGKIEHDAQEKTGLKAEVVSLYGGGQYHLYLYKRFDDVRIVFAPEASIAFFGGDPDNFEFPRFDLDMTIMRAYENGKPASIKNFFKWAEKGVEDKDLVFVSGHPGKTDRMMTLAGLTYDRDARVPFLLKMLQRREAALLKFSELGEEQARQAREDLFSIQNSRKVYVGRVDALNSTELFKNKEAEEAFLKKTAAERPELKANLQAWTDVEKAYAKAKEIVIAYRMLEGAYGIYTNYFGIARTLVRMADEDLKPDAERLKEYHQAARKSLELVLYSDEAIYNDFETAKLEDSLGFLQEVLGADSAIAQKILAGKTPAERAKELISGTTLASVETRKALAAGGKAAIDASTDPMILLAKAIDAESRAVRTEIEKNVDEVLSQANKKIADVIFAVKGTSAYPDATFTLRLAFGAVKGYSIGGKDYPIYTDIGGAYAHETAHGAVDPFKLPESWKKVEGTIEKSTPFNFVSTADIIGGNSGSPVLNKDGELVGLIFDGNIQSLALDYGFEERVARAISVDVRAMREALKNIYGANELLSQIGK